MHLMNHPEVSHFVCLQPPSPSILMVEAQGIYQLKVPIPGHACPHTLLSNQGVPKGFEELLL